MLHYSDRPIKPQYRCIAVRTKHGLNTRSQAFKLTLANGAEMSVDQAKCLIGSSQTAQVKVEGPNIAPEHAELQQKGKQVFLKALQGESLFDRTYTWLDGSEARPNVSYVLASGSTLAFGEEYCSYVIEFEEPSGSNSLIEMMMKGVAASANPDVQKALQ